METPAKFTVRAGIGEKEVMHGSEPYQAFPPLPFLPLLFPTSVNPLRMGDTYPQSLG